MNEKGERPPSDASQKLAEAFAVSPAVKSLENPTKEDSAADKVINAAEDIYQKLEAGKEAAEELQKEKEKNREKFEKLKKELDEANEAKYIDKRTGLYNSDFWEFYVEKFNSEEGGMASILLCDLNGLKKLNDNEGHLAGDNYIKNFASFLKKNFNRKSDFIIRYGGDEFAIVSSPSEENQNFESYVKERFDPDKLKELGLDFAYGIAHFDSSIDKDGLSFIEHEGMNLSKEELKNKKTTFQRADDLMYQKKIEQKAGRQD